MKTIEQTYRERLKMLVEEFGARGNEKILIQAKGWKNTTSFIAWQAQPKPTTSATTATWRIGNISQSSQRRAPISETLKLIQFTIK